MNEVDRTDAPTGYVAKRYGGKRGYTCGDCAFVDSHCPRGGPDRFLCFPSNREDRQSVIFVKQKPKKEKQNA